AVERANYEYAVRLLRQVLSQDPGYANARHVLRATERRWLEEKGKSPLAGVLWPAHALVALVRAELAKGPKKLEVYEDYLEKHPGSSWGAFQLARAAEEAG
ncbi:MAG: hypothetical protein GTO31_13440, partial [Xanthomonadales bacterium]|nr:hypothetical protein [Xanthomonadales bacterium]